MDSICHAGSPVIECEFCGRIHYAPNSDLDFEEGELEELEKKHEQDPRKYIRNPDDAVSWGYLDGKQIVCGCPCNSVLKYEKFIWNHRYVIAKYFSLIAKKQEKQARDSRNIADKVKNSLQKIEEAEGTSKNIEDKVKNSPEKK